MNDHFVSQTYLSAFTNTDGYLIPYYKANHVILGSPKLPKSVCYEVDGDSNEYFGNPRVLDSYLPQFENHWKYNVELLRQHILDDIAKYQMAGYIAFLRACTPTAKRLGQATVKAVVQPLIERMSEQYFMEHPPEDEETKKMIGQPIEQKRIRTEIDRQFPHALGIDALIGLTARYFYGTWLVLINRSEMPFVTGDNPAVPYYHTNSQAKANTYVPVAPDIALLIEAGLDEKPIAFPLKGESFSPSDRFAVVKTQYVEVFNDLVIKAAEQRVFSNNVYGWLESKVREYKEWKMETVVNELRTRKAR